MNSALLKDLLDLGDAFEQTHPDRADQTLPAFLAWAGQRSQTDPAGSLNSPLADAPKDPNYRYYAEDVPVLQTFVAHYLTKASRYLRVYMKKAVEDTPLVTFDDFISLANLAERGSMTKTDLVEAAVNEKTSGMLVIKRLIDNGFLTQSDDEQDKRSRRLTITPAGYAMLRQVQPAMNQASALFTGDLTETEQRQLSALLLRLDKFHEPIYLAHLAHREMPLDELKETVARSVNTVSKSA